MEEQILSQFITDYQILKKIGKGSYGRVYKVKRKIDNEFFALKIIDIYSMNEKTLQNTLNEIRFLSSIESNYVCGYEESFTIKDGQILCIILEYVGGGDLHSKIEICLKNNIELQEELIWKYLCQILAGLKILHELQIMHRDIKSQNLFLSENFNTIKLGDLGIAKLTKFELGKTQIGTPYYLAPEIWKNDIYDYRCDIYSLGCVVFEMCSQKVPFSGNSLLEIYRQVKNGLKERIPSIYSEELQKIIQYMMTKDYQKRPTAKQLLSHKIIKEKCIKYNIIIDYKEDKKDPLLDTIMIPQNFQNLKLPRKKRNKSCEFLHHLGENPFEKQETQQQREYFSTKPQENTQDQILLHQQNKFLLPNKKQIPPLKRYSCNPPVQKSILKLQKFNKKNDSNLMNRHVRSGSTNIQKNQISYFNQFNEFNFNLQNEQIEGYCFINFYFFYLTHKTNFK